MVGNQYAYLIDSLKPVSTIEVKDSMTSLSLAWNLYQDATLAEDLIARNRVASGSFLDNKIQYREL